MGRKLENFELSTDSSVLSGKMVVIGTTQNRSENAFRLIKMLDTKGNELNLLTNRFDLSADKIVELYKSRWAIELFFKWKKQHLNIKKFYGQSEKKRAQSSVHRDDRVLFEYARLALHKKQADVLADQSLLESSFMEPRTSLAAQD